MFTYANVAYVKYITMFVQITIFISKWVYPTVLDLFGYFGHLSLIFHNPNRILGIFFTNYSKSRIILDNKLKGLGVYYFKKQIGLLDFKYGARRINIKKKAHGIWSCDQLFNQMQPCEVFIGAFCKWEMRKGVSHLNTCEIFGVKIGLINAPYSHLISASRVNEHKQTRWGVIITHVNHLHM